MFSPFVVHLFVLDLNHSDHRNNFCPQKVQYSWQQIWWPYWGTKQISVDLIFLSPWTLVRIQAPVCNSLQSVLPSDLVKFGLKLSDLFRYELLWLYMLCFTVNSAVFILIWTILTWNLILFVFYIYSRNRACVVGNKRCHLLNPVSHKRCHRLSAVIQKRCSSRTTLSKTPPARCQVGLVLGLYLLWFFPIVGSFLL